MGSGLILFSKVFSLLVVPIVALGVLGAIRPAWTLFYRKERSRLAIVQFYVMLFFAWMLGSILLLSAQGYRLLH